MCLVTRLEGHRYHLVEGLTWAACLLVVGFLLGTGLALCQETPVLDFTVPRLPGGGSLGVPGIVVGGVIGGPESSRYPPRYRLPLEARIRAIKPDTVSAQETFVVELELRNRGDTPFYLPRLRDELKAHRPGNKRRQRFRYYFGFTLPHSKEEERALLELTDGSESVPDSLLRLAPGESVLVLLLGDLRAVHQRLPSEPVDIGVRLVCDEYLLEDEQFSIKAVSREIESENSVLLHVYPERPPHQ